MNPNERFLTDVDPRRGQFARSIDPDKVEEAARQAHANAGYVPCPMTYGTFDVVWKVLLPQELFSERSHRLALGERIHDTPPIVMPEEVAEDLAAALNAARTTRAKGN